MEEWLMLTCIGSNRKSSFWSLIALVVGLLSPDISHSQDSSGVTKVGSLYHLWNYVQGVTVQGNYAYLSTRQSGLSVIDISDPENPREVSFYDSPGDTRSTTIVGNYAYLADGAAGIRVVDITDSSHPFEVGFLNTPGLTNEIAIAGNWAYVADGDNGLRIIDISNPGRPRGVSFYHTSEYVHEVAVSGNFVYLIDSRDGLLIIDVSFPRQPHLIGRYSPGFLTDVEVVGNYAYLLGADFTILDIHDPTRPFEIGRTWSWQKYSMVINGNYAYLGGNGGVSVLNIADPTSPREVLSHDAYDRIAGLAVAGNYVYLAAGYDGFYVANFRRIPFDIGNLNARGTLYSITKVDNTVYLADEYMGMRIVDVRDPVHPAHLGFYSAVENWQRVTGIAVSGNFAYIACSEIQVIDIRNPAEPSPVAVFEIDGTQGIVVRGNYAYTANRSHGLLIVDISDPNQPHETGRCDSPGEAQNVDINGNYAYLADGSHGLRVIDISDPSSPFEAAFYNSPRFAQHVTIKNDYAYLADGSGGVRFVSISDPLQPFEDGFYDSPGNASDADATEDFVFVADGLAGLRIVDITDPTQSHEVGYYLSPGSARGVLVGEDGLIYVASSYSIDIYDCSEAMSVSSSRPTFSPFALALSSFPNPFNARTTITYSLPVPSVVRLALYNPIGERVYESAPAFQPAGSHSVILNGNGLPSGTYLLNLQAGSHSQTSSIVLEK
jgi:hypothetical protein